MMLFRESSMNFMWPPFDLLSTNLHFKVINLGLYIYKFFIDLLYPVRMLVLS